MSGICLVAAAMSATLSVALPHEAFTLAWTHSIEKIRWEEDYRIAGDGLELTEARILGSGAGMEPPEGAMLMDGVWHYRPQLPVLKRVTLARSDFVADYEICNNGVCRSMATLAGPAAQSPVIEIAPCVAMLPAGQK